MLVRHLSNANDETYWKIILLADQNDQQKRFCQQTESLKFNQIGCRVFTASTPEDAMELLAQNPDTALIVLGMNAIESTLLEIKQKIDKSIHPALCVIAVTSQIEKQKKLLNTMQVDHVTSSFDEAHLTPSLLSGLKRHYDMHLLQLSRTLLHSMTKIDEASTGNTYLRDLAVSMAKVLGTHFVVIGETDLSDDSIVNTRVVWMGGEYMDNFTYERKGSPCERVLECERIITYPQSVATKFPEDEMLAQMGIESYMGTAIHSPAGDLVGILITMDKTEMINYQVYEPVLDFFASRVGVEIERQRAQDKLLQINEELEIKVKLRTRELEDSHKELLQLAHQAGMADIAAGVLHNVGNVFNSIWVASQVMDVGFSHSKLSRLTDVADMLEKNKHNLVEYLTTNEKGQQLPEYVKQLSKVLVEESNKHKESLQSILNSGQLMQDIVRNQLNYAKLESVIEKCEVVALVDKLILMQAPVMEKHHIIIEKNYADVPAVYLQEHKFMNVLTNVFKNAAEAMKIVSAKKRIIKIKIYKQAEFVNLVVSDSGDGFTVDQLQKIFSLGYSTKKNGHGIGLHVSSIYMQEMGGELSASNSANNAGASFTLRLPTQKILGEK